MFTRILAQYAMIVEYECAAVGAGTEAAAPSSEEDAHAPLNLVIYRFPSQQYLLHTIGTASEHCGRYLVR